MRRMYVTEFVVPYRPDMPMRGRRVLTAHTSKREARRQRPPFDVLAVRVYSADPTLIEEFRPHADTTEAG